MAYMRQLLIAALALSAVMLSAQTKEDVKKLYDQKDYLSAVGMISQIENEYKKDDRAQILFGDVYLAMDNVKEAYKYYLNAQEIEGDEHYILHKLAVANSRMGSHDRALVLINEAIDDEDLVEYQVDKIEILALKGDYDAARKQADRVIRDNPKNLKALKFLGDVYHMQRVYDVSKDNYEKLLQIDPSYVEARLKLAEAYYWLGQRTGTTEEEQKLANAYFKRSLDEYNKVTKQDPTNAPAFFEQGRILFWSNQYLPAAQALSQFVKLRPDSDIGHWLLAQSFNELGSCDSAAPHLKIAAERIDSVRDKANLMLARCYSEQREYAKARTELERLSQTMELDLNDRRRLATATLFTGDTTKAIALYKELVQEDPEKQCGVMKTVGQLLVSMKQYEEALWFLNKRLSVDACADPETDGQIYYFQGLSYLFLEKYAEAEMALLKSLEIDSTNSTAILYLADSYFNLGKEAEALQAYQDVIALAKADPSARNSSLLNSTYSKLAEYHRKAKAYPEMTKVSEEWVEVAPDSPYGWIYLGMGRQAAGNVVGACDAYKKALELDPDNSTAKKLSDGLC